MVITIEPGMCKLLFCVTSVLTLLSSIGVYIPADPQFPEHFHGFGMRIEDEVLIGAESPVVLSASAPKEVCRHPHRIPLWLMTMRRVPGSIGFWTIMIDLCLSLFNTSKTNDKRVNPLLRVYIFEKSKT